MSIVVSILFVIGLFALVGFAAWLAVMFGLTISRGAESPALVRDASLDESRETIGAYAG